MDLHELYVGCRTYRRFTQEPVGEEIVLEALENARIGSSAKNAQPLRYIAVTSPEAVRDMQPLVKWAAALPPEIGTPKEGEQPTAFILVIKKADAIAFADAINGPAIKQRFGIPEEDTLRLAIALGYPAHRSTIVDMPEDGGYNYFVDEKRDYYVPKRAFDDVVRFA